VAAANEGFFKMKNENNQYSPISTFHLHLASHTLAGGVKGHSSHSRLTGPFRIETSVTQFRFQFQPLTL
jgi:hypothetical protein